MDPSNGYEAIASRFIQVRGQAVTGIGTSSVRTWAGSLLTGSAVLDLGCGTGMPISKVLIEAGMQVYGVDASPTLVKAFQKNFPAMPVICEPVEDSLFFQRQFDGIICWGLLFLLGEKAQELLIQKAARALQTGGKFLFTAPYQATSWQDVLTRQESRSLGAARYQQLLDLSGLQLLSGFTDESQNYYYNTVKIT